MIYAGAVSHRLMRIVVATAVALGTAPARAMQSPAPAAPGQDTVVLRDGAVLRGTILEVVAGTSITMATGAGQTRTLAWAEVASTTLGPQPPVPSASTPTVPPTVPPTVSPTVSPTDPPPGPGRPRIHIELARPAPVRLFEASAAAMMGHNANFAALQMSARSVCVAPCDRVIDGSQGYPYFFGGDRLVPSRPIYLSELEGEYVARVRPGRRGVLIGGVLATAYGFTGALAGGIVTGVARERTQVTGGIVLGVSAALLISGIVMLVHGTTRVKMRRR